MQLTSGDKTNGGTGSSQGVAALGGALAGTEIGAGITLIQTAGYYVVGKGAANYVYDPVVNAAYVAEYPRVSFLSADGRGFRLDIDQHITFFMVGAVGDNVTDDHPALQNALKWCGSFNINPQAPEGNLRGSIPLYGSPGTFYMSDTWDFTWGSIHVDGLGTGMAARSTCILEFAPDKTGIRLQRNDTAGRDERSNPYSWGADGSVFKNIKIKSRGGVSRGSRYGAHGFHAKCRFLAQNVGIEDFPGNGFHILAQAGASGDTAWKHGNANNWIIIGGSSYNNRGSGYYVEGADANAGTALGCDAGYNDLWGFDDQSFLGNCYTGCHTASNGTGSYRFLGDTNRSVGVGCYAEGNQNNPYMGQHATWMPALTETSGRASAVDGPGTSFFALFGAMTARAFKTEGDGVNSVQLGSNGGNRMLSMGTPLNNFVLGTGDGTFITLGIGESSTPPFIITGQGTGYTFGRADAQVHAVNIERFALGFAGNNSARVITYDEGPPTSGSHAKGEIIFNNGNNASNDSVDYWRCTQSGTPGTWVARS